ncbi:MAG TPA: tetraacyldisaccharide 4'-kinase [Chitinophagaceae bacterium]|nr:tetraacyldisaccharide 4'-kinase [Chitinophagaceae bacterium]
MFPEFFLRSFRLLLFPFSLFYWLGIAIRNWLYDKNILKSASFGLPIICVGNLSVGGTGKSPMVEYLLLNFKTKFRLATLSRGYKRKTKGYALANAQTTALELGDEPMQFFLKFPEIPIAVGEERIEAIPQLLHDRPETQAIILDDAFQHRAIKAGLNILLTDYSNLFTRDFYLPTGDLRDQKKSYRRANVIVVTKCDPKINEEEKQKIISEINPVQGQQIFFTTTKYGSPYHLINKGTIGIKHSDEVLLVSGIANPAPLKKMLEDTCGSYSMLRYSDHHIFTVDDLRDIKRKFENLQGENRYILTTEKDAVRLIKFRQEIENLPFYIVPVGHFFLFNGGSEFNELVDDFIRNFKKQ